MSEKVLSAEWPVLAVDMPRRVCLTLFGMLMAGLGVGLFLKFASPDPYGVSVVYFTKQFFFLTSSMDSWLPMRQAFEFWFSHKDSLLYTNVFFDQLIRFQYPPTSMFISMWLGPVQRDLPNPAYTATLLVSMAVIWLTTARILEIAFGRHGVVLERRSDRAALYGLVGALMLMFYPIVLAFNVGQLQLWLDALFAMSLLAWMNGRKSAAGVLIGLICLMKPQLAVFLPWALLRKEWSFSRAMMAVGAIGLIVSVLQFGLANNLDYLKVLSFLSQRGEPFYPNQSVNGLVSRLVGLTDPGYYSSLVFAPEGRFTPPNTFVHLATLSSTAIFLGLAILRPARFQGDRLVDFCVMALSATIASPIAWEHHYGVLFPIFAVMLPLCWGRPARLAVLAGSYLVVSQFISITNALADTAWNFLQSYLFFAALVVLGALYRLSLNPIARPAYRTYTIQAQAA